MGILKKGQLQVQETIFVVFVFVIIIVLGMTLFFRFQESSLKNDIKDFRLKNLGDKLLSLPDSNEFVYTEAGIKKNAVDIVKLIALKNLINRRESYFFSKYGFMNITIYQIYPESNRKECSSSNLLDCGLWKIYENVPKKVNSKIRKETPVSLYFPNKEEYTIGILSIEVYNI